MRIAIFIPGFQTDQADWCVPAFTNLARKLTKEAEVEVFALRHPAIRSTYNVGKVRVHAIGGGAFGPVRIPGLSLTRLWLDLLRRFSQVHHKGRFDAILGIWGTESGALACVAGKREGIPVIVHLAGGELVRLEDIGYGNWRRGLSGRLAQISLRRADLLTFPSGYVERLLARRTQGSATAKAAFWPLGVDTAFFAPRGEGEPSRPITFIAAASLLPVKGLDLLVAGAAELRSTWPDRDFRVVLVGDGPGRADLMEKITALNLAGYVILRGELRHDGLPGELAAAHCFVVTSRHEAQCMALLEACSMGLTWIATNVGAAADLAALPEKSGILLKDRSPGGLAKAMSAMVDLSVSARSEMGATARRQVLDSYDLVKQTGRLVTLLEALTAARLPHRMESDSPGSVTGDVIKLTRELVGYPLRHPRR